MNILCVLVDIKVGLHLCALRSHYGFDPFSLEKRLHHKNEARLEERLNAFNPLSTFTSDRANGKASFISIDQYSGSFLEKVRSQRTQVENGLKERDSKLIILKGFPRELF